MDNVREIAYEALLTIEKSEQGNSFIDDILDKYSYLEKMDRSFLNRLIAGVIERRITLDYVINQFSKISVNKMKKPVRTLVRMGVYQLLYMDSVPQSAAVNETVKLAKKRGLSNLSGFINGVLRNISRNIDNIKYPDEMAEPNEYLSVKYSCPKWIVDILTEEQGYAGAKSLLELSVTVRPITARVNIGKISVENVIEQNSPYLTQNEFIPNAVYLNNVDRVADITAIQKGDIVVQDISSMLVCHVAGIKKDDVIIDVCASPGGKTMHAADLARTGLVISCDLSEDKVARIRENVDRCGFDNVDVRVVDATHRSDELVNKADILIVDAPCSGLGVMGRKNDIKHRLTREGMDELPQLQHRIIDNVLDYLKSGGIMIYSTCTVHRAENEECVNYILDSNQVDAVDFYNELPPELRKETAKQGYIQLLGENGYTDGFFIAKFRKR